MSDIETSSDDDFEVVQRPRQTKQSFEVEEGAFPAFGGPAQAAASTSMDFSSAWASTKAPTAMPQPIARRRPAAQAQTASNEPEPSSEGPSIPWRSSDWDHKMANVPQWSGPAPRKFAEPADPYAQVSAGKPHPVQARAPVAPKSQTRSEEAPKPKKEKKEPASLVVDGDGFMEVASRKSRPDQAVSKQSTVKVVETSSSFGALMMDEQANTPKKETPKENGKKPNGKKQQQQPKQQPKQNNKKKAAPAPAPAPEEPLVFKKNTVENRERNTKKKSSSKKKGSNKQAVKEQQANPQQSMMFMVLLAGVAVAVAFGFRQAGYFAKSA